MAGTAAPEHTNEPPANEPPLEADVSDLLFPFSFCLFAWFALNLIHPTGDLRRRRFHLCGVVGIPAVPYLPLVPLEQCLTAVDVLYRADDASYTSSITSSILNYKYALSLVIVIAIERDGKADRLSNADTKTAAGTMHSTKANISW